MPDEDNQDGKNVVIMSLNRVSFHSLSSLISTEWDDDLNWGLWDILPFSFDNARTKTYNWIEKLNGIEQFVDK